MVLQDCTVQAGIGAKGLYNTGWNWCYRIVQYKCEIGLQDCTVQITTRATGMYSTNTKQGYQYK